MSAIAKPVYTGAAGLTWMDDDTYSVEELWSVTGCTSTKEISVEKEAIDAATTASILLDIPGSWWTSQGIQLLRATAKLQTDDMVTVMLTWGTNDTPRLDGPWIVESTSNSSRESRGVDVNNDAITIEYVNETMLSQPAPAAALTKAEFLAVWGNKKRFQRGVTVPGFYNRVHVQARRQISKEKANGMSVHPNRWPAKYVDWVNNEIPRGSGGTYLVPKGVFRCANIRVYTRNRGFSWLVDAEFILDKLGHEAMVLFTDSDGLIPGDVEIPENMKLPWPPTADDRYSAAGDAGDPPGGATRPQMLKGGATFSNPPFNLDLEPFYAD